MSLMEILALQQTCENRMSCEACPEKSKKCSEYKGLLANIKEPWEITRLIDDMGDYANEEG